MENSLFAILTSIPIFWTILIFVFRSYDEIKGLAFVAAIISWVSWVSVGLTAVEIDLAYNWAIVFLYVLCALPEFLLMIVWLPESWKKPKSEV